MTGRCIAPLCRHASALGTCRFAAESGATNPGRMSVKRILSLCIRDSCDQCVDVGVLKSLGGRIGRGYSQSLSTCYGTDDGNIALATCFLEMVESGCNHSYKSFNVGTCGVEFDFPVLNSCSGSPRRS